MKWFEGSIAQAVTASKKLNAIFVVYIEGKDDLSATLTSALENPLITASLDTESFVNVRLEKGSQSHTQFSEIYKLVPVPSVFFIGQNGAPVEIVVGDSSQQNVISKLTAAIHKCDVPDSVKPKLVSPDPAQPSTSQPVETLPETSAKSSDVSTMNPVVEEQKIEGATGSVSTKVVEKMEVDKEPELEVPTVAMDSKVVGNEATAVGNEGGENVVSAPLSSPPPLEERIERAKELLEKKKEEKRKQDEKEERERELERRRVGQELLEAKRRQHERELKELKEERMREKQADYEAKQRVLDQIAQDRAERLARMQTTPAPSAEPAAVAQPQQPRRVVYDSNEARIQFKLPDGRTRTHVFPTNTTMSQVRQFIDNNIELPFREYQMATTFPRREFTYRDNDSDLNSLELTPTAVLLIMPVQGNMSVRRSGGWTDMFTGLFWDLVQPFISISRYLQSLVWGAPPPPAAEPRPPNNTTPSTAQPQRTMYSPPQPQSRAGVRKRGNIHSLADSDGSNDENNTWNGNSTQQM